MALTALGIIAGLGSAGATAYAASQSGGGGGGGTGNVQRVGTPFATGGQSYLARLFALNAGQRSPSFADYVKSGGTAKFDLQGAGQFTPLEAQRLGLVGQGNTPTPFFDPTQQNRLNEQQVLFIGADRAARRRQGQLEGAQTPEESLFSLSQRIQRQERTLRTGNIKGQRAQKITRQIARDRELAAKTRAQLFGAPYTPGPWQMDQQQAGSDGGGGGRNYPDYTQDIIHYGLGAGIFGG